MKLTYELEQFGTGPRELEFDKVAVLVGRNGSGKSGILRSVFQQKLENNVPEDKRIVCFSTSPNENYSQIYQDFIDERKDPSQSFTRDCCHFNRDWSELLVFSALVDKPKGRVGGFFEKNYKYSGKSDNGKFNPEIEFEFRISQENCEKILNERTMRLEGRGEELLDSWFYDSLNRLVNWLKKKGELDKNYQYEKEIELRIKLSVEDAREILLIASGQSAPSSDVETNTVELNSEYQLIEESAVSAVEFFTQAAYKDIFIEKKDINLNIKRDLELNEFSDGEYQLLYLMALIDLFDSEDTLFLLDDADSHLHFESVEWLWKILDSIEGDFITTTHLIDSILAPENKPERLYFVEEGIIVGDAKFSNIYERLDSLSRLDIFKNEICGKFEFLAILDNDDDWLIFTELAKRKGCFTECPQFKNIHVIVKSSGYDSINERFAGEKLDWVNELSSFKSEHSTKAIFLICDRDKAALKFKSDGVKITGAKFREEIERIKRTGREHDKIFDCHLLAWNRVDVKNYLLSYSALSDEKYGKLDEVNDDRIAVQDYLKLSDAGDNESIGRMNAKDVIDSIVYEDKEFSESEKKQISEEMLKEYASKIPPAEISEDISSMYYFIMQKMLKAHLVTTPKHELNADVRELHKSIMEDFKDVSK